VVHQVVLLLLPLLQLVLNLLLPQPVLNLPLLLLPPLRLLQNLRPSQVNRS
jgi:hypothetical protein